MKDNQQKRVQKYQQRKGKRRFLIHNRVMEVRRPKFNTIVIMNKENQRKKREKHNNKSHRNNPRMMTTQSQQVRNKRKTV